MFSYKRGKNYHHHRCNYTRRWHKSTPLVNSYKNKVWWVNRKKSTRSWHQYWDHQHPKCAGKRTSQQMIIILRKRPSLGTPVPQSTASCINSKCGEKRTDEIPEGVIWNTCPAIDGTLLKLMWKKNNRWNNTRGYHLGHQSPNWQHL